MSNAYSDWRRDEAFRALSIAQATSDTIDALVHAAFRYYLGRRTIATCAFARGLARVWGELGDDVQEMIALELDEAFAADDEYRSKGYSNLPLMLGDDCDREAWEEVRKAYSHKGEHMRP